MSGPNSSDGRPRELDGLRADVSLWLYGTVADGVRFARPEPGPTSTTICSPSQPRRSCATRNWGSPPTPVRTMRARRSAVRCAATVSTMRNVGHWSTKSWRWRGERGGPARILRGHRSRAPKILDSLVFYGDVEDAALTAILDAPDAATPELVAAAWFAPGLAARRHRRPAAVVRQRPDPRRVGVERAATRVDGHLGHPGGR